MESLSLGVGPMSSEIIEAVFRVSHYHRRPLMLIASKNQIDYSGGYVNSWTTKEYMDFITQMRALYPNSSVKICRDHCGPGFNGKNDLADTYNTIKEDITQGFDLIHIDFCHFKGSKDEMLEESKKAILKCLELNPSIELEIGTDENVGTHFTISNIRELEEEIDFFKEFCNPKYFVVQTGSLVKEINQAGTFNKEFIFEIAKMAKRKGIELKEHNADYLSKSHIDLRTGIIDAMNIAPQLGVVQTSLIIQKCLSYGISIDKFVEKVYEGRKWEKWLHKNDASNKFLCVFIAGHYHFSSEEYKDIISQLEEREDIKENIINEISEVINHYEY